MHRNASRKENDLLILLSVSATDLVSCTAYGVYKWLLKALVYFLTDFAHLCINQVGLRIEMKIPYTFKQHRAGNNLLRTAHEIFKQLKFSVLQGNFFSCPCYRAC